MPSPRKIANACTGSLFLDTSENAKLREKFGSELALPTKLDLRGPSLVDGV
jgi:hypothetical protein